jgi:hypothetical protein
MRPEARDPLRNSLSGPQLPRGAGRGRAHVRGGHGNGVVGPSRGGVGQGTRAWSDHAIRAPRQVVAAPQTATELEVRCQERAVSGGSSIGGVCSAC